MEEARLDTCDELIVFAVRVTRSEGRLAECKQQHRVLKYAWWYNSIVWKPLSASRRTVERMIGVVKHVAFIPRGAVVPWAVLADDSAQFIVG